MFYKIIVLPLNSFRKQAQSVNLFNWLLTKKSTNSNPKMSASNNSPTSNQPIDESSYTPIPKEIKPGEPSPRQSGFSLNVLILTTINLVNSYEDDIEFQKNSPMPPPSPTKSQNSFSIYSDSESDTDSGSDLGSEVVGYSCISIILSISISDTSFLPSIASIVLSL